MTAIKLDPDTEQRLQRLAELSGWSASVQLDDIIRTGLEDREDAAAADRVVARIETGAETLHSAKAPRVELGLDD